MVLASADITGAEMYKSESWVLRDGGSNVPPAKAAWRIWVAKIGSWDSGVKVWVPLREATWCRAPARNSLYAGVLWPEVWALSG